MKKVILSALTVLIATFAIAQDTELKSGTIKGKKGIIRFDMLTWSDATGHFDLWNGNEMVESSLVDNIGQQNLFVYEIENNVTGEIVSSFATDLDLAVGVMVDYILKGKGGASDGLSAQTSGVQRSKHDAAMAAIQNIR